MKTQIIKNASLLTLVSCALLAGNVYALEDKGNEQRNWDEERSQKEDVLWEKDIEKWSKLAAEWDEKRQAAHQKYDEELVDDMDSRKYCRDGFCWSESLLTFSFKNEQTGEDWDLWKDSSSMKVVFSDGSTMSVVNDGQSARWEKSGGDAWESINEGQGITYKNTAGDFWETVNTGQTVKFKAADGRSWEASNYGQSVEHKDAEGKAWEGSDMDNIDDMKFMRDKM